MYRTEQENISKELLRYGVFIKDIETEEVNGYRRIRIIKYQNKKYFHHMFNGQLIECCEI